LSFYQSGYQMENFKLHSINQKLVLLTIFSLSLAILFQVYDVVNDILHDVGEEHILTELLIFSLLIGCSFLLNYLRQKNEKKIFTHLLDKDFEILSLKEKNERISVALKSSITQQFIEWNLTESEIEIAFLIIKGFSNQEIADIRSTAEKTIRDQSSKIYHKANLKNRAQLTAFFFEELL